MARRRKKSYRRKAKPSICEIGAFGVIPITRAKAGYDAGGFGTAAAYVIGDYTGYSTIDGSFRTERMMRGLAPTAAIFGVGILGRKMGLNRYAPKWLPFKIF